MSKLIGLRMALALVVATVLTLAPSRDASAKDQKGSLDFDRIEAELTKPATKVRSVEHLLAWIAKRYPEFLGHFSLMYESGSLQGASEDNPRAIAYGKKAEFILTFNGEASQAGFHTVEMIQFRSLVSSDKTTRRVFEFREIEFDPAGKGLAHVSEANPAKCMRCHGIALQPKWHNYDNWPGAYGSDDDALIDFDHDKYAYRGQAPEVIARHRKELAGFVRFRDGVMEHPRYQFLKFLGDAPHAPYIPTGRSGNYPLRPNLELTHRLTDLNGQYLADRLASRQSCFKSYAPLLTAYLIGCANQSYGRFSAPMKRAGQVVKERLLAAAPGMTLRRWSTYGPEWESEELPYILTFMGVEVDHWNLASHPQHWVYFAGAEYLRDSVARELFTKLGKAGIKLPDFVRISQQRYPEYYPLVVDGKEVERYEVTEEQQREVLSHYLNACDALVGASAKLEATAPTTPCIEASAKDPQAMPDTVRMCLSCHGRGGKNAPVLALDDRAALKSDAALVEKIKTRIGLEHGARGHMPPDRRLTEEERRELLRYVGGE